MHNYYEVLGLKSDCTIEDIKKSYRDLSIKLHPDSNNGNKFLEEQFKIVSEAYKVLSNENIRLEYDINNGFRSKNSFSVEEIIALVDYVTSNVNDRESMYKNLYQMTLSERMSESFLKIHDLVNIKQEFAKILNNSKVKDILFEKCIHCNCLSYRENKICESCNRDKRVKDNKKLEICPKCGKSSETKFNICEHCSNYKR